MSAPYYQDGPVTVFHGDCVEVMHSLPDGSVDAVVTDPPYGLEFMGKEWDRYTPADFEAWCAVWAAECLRVLKPGGHLLAFGGSRTWHRLAAGIEDAGFEVRDSIAWLYGSGFPKSLDVSKAIDKAAGVERDIPGRHARVEDRVVGVAGNDGRCVTCGRQRGGQPGNCQCDKRGEPVTDAAREWQGWGTTLKPAFEPIVVARKPLAKGHTVAANVLSYGTGALNIDAARVGSESTARKNRAAIGYDEGMGVTARKKGAQYSTDSDAGRWPANVVLDESQAAALDQQPGGKSLNGSAVWKGGTRAHEGWGNVGKAEPGQVRGGFGDSGGASRFFYTAKADSAERPNVDGVSHPTVKPLDLMQWLVRLVTPPGGTVLEPFAGSGTTIEAAVLENFTVIGIEREADYLPLIMQRVRKPHTQSLFDLDGAA